MRESLMVKTCDRCPAKQTPSADPYFGETTVTPTNIARHNGLEVNP